MLVVDAHGTVPKQYQPTVKSHNPAPQTALDKAHDHIQHSEDDAAPLMPHEGRMGTGGLEVDPPGFYEMKAPYGRRTSLGFGISHQHTIVPPEPTAEDLKDSEIEKFPTDRKSILARMATLKQELRPDESVELTTSASVPFTPTLTRALSNVESYGIQGKLS